MVEEAEAEEEEEEATVPSWLFPAESSKTRLTFLSLCLVPSVRNKAFGCYIPFLHSAVENKTQ